jgi:glycine/D-amino acid oxidase-like deaminating enzyme
VKVAVIGAGWAGLAAAVEATAQSHRVTLYDMAPQCGGRARSVETNGLMLDNGQHIMIGAYTELLRLMRLVGADSQRLLLRTPLALLDGSGVGLRLRPGLPVFAFGRAVVEHEGRDDSKRNRLGPQGLSLQCIHRCGDIDETDAHFVARTTHRSALHRRPEHGFRSRQREGFPSGAA